MARLDVADKVIAQGKPGVEVKAVEAARHDSVDREVKAELGGVRSDRCLLRNEVSPSVPQIASLNRPGTWKPRPLASLRKKTQKNAVSRAIHIVCPLVY